MKNLVNWTMLLDGITRKLQKPSVCLRTIVIRSLMPACQLSGIVVVTNNVFGAKGWLKSLVNLAEDPGSVPVTHMEAHNHS